MTSNSIAILALVVAGILTGCQSTSGNGNATPQRSTLPGLQYNAADGWVKESPTSQARVAQYTLPAEDTTDDPAELIFYYFGRDGAGTVEANIDRWLGQFELEGEAPAPEVWTRYGLRVHAVDVEGRYIAPINPTSEERHDKPDYAMHAAIVETAVGPYYIRMTGPRVTVDHWQSSWDRMIKSLRPASATESDVDSAASHNQPTGG